MADSIILVTGANRGIGKGLVAELLRREKTTVIAAVRTLNNTSTEDLESLPKGRDSRLVLIKIDSSSETDASTASEQVQQQFGIDHVDTIIANAGIGKYYGPVASTPMSEIKDHFTVNVLGSLAVFQAFWPLLQLSSTPKFVAITTGLASIADMANFPIPSGAYGASKAMLNYLVRKLHFENEALTAFVISPGWVQTDMGNAGAVSSGMKEAPVTLQDSVAGILNKVDLATRDRSGGNFQSFDEATFAW
ncbi:Norsolorinic acid ketoreductase nor1-like protein 2 [Elsinoe fawcettii]|nr:Norsolorinic acid ketoreductase nor1-like protein 2 [Elsinoe fawcettii]